MPSHVRPMKLKIPVSIRPLVTNKMMRSRKWKQRRRTLILIGFYSITIIVMLFISIRSIIRYVRT